MVTEEKVKRFISLNKIKMQRGYSYISTFGIPFLVARSLGDLFSFNWMFFFAPAIIFVWVLGHFDFKRGLYGNELEYSFTQNPEWMKKIDELKKEKVK